MPQDSRGRHGDDLPVPAGDVTDNDVAQAAQSELEQQRAADAAGDAQRQIDEQKDRYLRLAAEFDNYRKRTMRERHEAGARAQADLLRKLLDPLDDLGRVTAGQGPVPDAYAVVTGVEAIRKKLMDVLGAIGLEVISPVDEPFDPELQEAVATEPALSPEDDHVVSQVYQPGYRFQGQLLRPARVVVKQWTD
ncbi:MAG TPA: nucleotide exchange factor GrpE [Gemmatimonadaceae bacterium]|nr:nucleotide exchange factor GrpE [Gemmatimonadaceae bacterium]